ncbi:MAG: hypothetical protein EA378_00600 [Phycisphaerales bacterium]|nr:MAG: hypothetical protein EA378_00600 [Phycisphaerales bacterium]
MHILTKVFVVIAAILSVGFAALAMTYSLNADRITRAYESERTARLAAQASAEAQVAQYEAQSQTLASQLAGVERTLADREARIRELQGETVRLMAEKRDAESARDSIQFQIDQLNQSAAKQLTLIESYRDEVRELRGSELAFRREKLELEDRINDLQNENDVFTQTVRALQEQIADLQLAVRDAEVGGTGTAREGATGRTLPTLVTGAVVEVTQDVNGRILARIDLGTNDGMERGLRLFVSRNNEFIANLQVVETDLNSAVAVVDTLGRGTEVRQNDRVLSRLQ